ncbi:hypothetical protein AEQU2_01783 [Aequorivita lipolytica]|nr:hypothetical protein AEQU2_01783 [Aequorivita lipolytica]
MFSLNSFSRIPNNKGYHFFVLRYLYGDSNFTFFGCKFNWQLGIKNLTHVYSYVIIKIIPQ